MDYETFLNVLAQLFDEWHTINNSSAYTMYELADLFLGDFYTSESFVDTFDRVNALDLLNAYYRSGE